MSHFRKKGSYDLEDSFFQNDGFGPSEFEREFSPEEIELMTRKKVRMIRDGYWKVETESFLEYLWKTLAVLGLLFAILALLDFNISLFSDLSKETQVILGFSAAGVFFFLYKNTDEYFIIDQNNRKLLFFSKIFNKKRTEELANFDEILGVVTTSYWPIDERKKVFPNARLELEVVLRGDNVITIADRYNTIKKFDILTLSIRGAPQITSLGEAVSYLLGTVFYPYIDGHYLKYSVVVDESGEETLEVDYIRVALF